MNSIEVKHTKRTNLSNELYIFWHIFVDPNHFERCLSIINRQFEKITNSGLLERCTCIYIGYVSTIDFPLPNILNNKKIKIIVHYKEGFEGVTTRALKKFCDDHKDRKFAILYIHNRGSTNYSIPAQDWTLMMEYFCIENWKKGLLMLNNKLTAGCEMFSHEPRIIQNKLGGLFNNFSNNSNNNNDFIYHYPGNFWWVRSDYIQMLPYPNFNNIYLDSEDWILSLADKTIDKNYFGVLHRTSKERYKRGMVHAYIDRYPIEYYRNANETPDKELDEKLFHGKYNYKTIWYKTSDD